MFRLSLFSLHTCLTLAVLACPVLSVFPCLSVPSLVSSTDSPPVFLHLSPLAPHPLVSLGCIKVQSLVQSLLVCLFSSTHLLCTCVYFSTLDICVFLWLPFCCLQCYCSHFCSHYWIQIFWFCLLKCAFSGLLTSCQWYSNTVPMAYSAATWTLQNIYFLYKVNTKGVNIDAWVETWSEIIGKIKIWLVKTGDQNPLKAAFLFSESVQYSFSAALGHKKFHPYCQNIPTKSINNSENLLFWSNEHHQVYQQLMQTEANWFF